MVAEGTSGVGDIIRSARRAGVRVDRIPRGAVDALARGLVHQGVVAETGEFAYRDWREGLGRAAEAGEPALFLAVDGVTDPHNLGSLLRSADAAGCHAVIVPA